MNPLLSDFNGMNIGLDYKITDHMSVGTSLNFSNNRYNMINQNTIGTYSPLLYPNGW